MLHNHLFARLRLHMAMDVGTLGVGDKECGIGTCGQVLNVNHVTVVVAKMR